MTARAVLVAAVLLALAACDRLEFESGRVIDKVTEPERRWWTAEDECLSRDWDTFLCLQTRTYEQEHIDGPDHVLNVLETYVRGSGDDRRIERKMRRVYVDPSLYARIEPGGEFTFEEFQGLAWYNDRHTEGSVRNSSTETNSAAVAIGVVNRVRRAVQ